MKTAITPSYGPPEVIELCERPRPTIGEHEVLVQVRAAPVTEGDRRLRSADFPGMSALFGRLAMGVTRPRTAVQGSMFAGRVVEVGASVTRFAVGDDVFGGTEGGAYAQFLAIAEDGAMARMPTNMSYEQAAAVPYGAGTALHFLRDLAKVEPGDEVLILGASGGVGRFAVQLAKHMGAVVTGVCSSANAELVTSLGADHVLDYKTTDFRTNGRRYDVIFDIADASSFRACRDSLTETGSYMTLYISLNVAWYQLWTSIMGGPQASVSIAMGEQGRTEALAELMEQGVIDPVIAHRFDFESLVQAHRANEAHSEAGAVVVSMAAAA